MSVRPTNPSEVPESYLSSAQPTASCSRSQETKTNSHPWTSTAIARILYPRHPVTAESLASSSDSAIIPGRVSAIPFMGDDLGLSLHRKCRLIAPCEGPSIATGDSKSLHVVDREGWTVRFPRKFLDRHGDRVKTAAFLSKYVMPVVGSALSFAIKFPNWIIDLATSEVTLAGKVVENKDRLDSAGVNPDNMFSVHDLIDLHQKKAMNRLLRSATRGKTSVTGGLKYVELQDKRRYWLCKDCISCLENGQPIDESDYMMYPRYQSLAKRERRNEITLDDGDSVDILTTSLYADSQTTNELILHIDSTYFEALERVEGSPFNSITHLFKELGRVIKRQKNLTLLEIHVNSTNGKVYNGLRAVLKCRALKKLRVSGIPCFLNDENIPIECQKLKELSLQDVHINTKQASGHLWTLIRANPGLKDGSASFNSELLRTTSTFLGAYDSVSGIVPTLHNNFILTSTTVLAQPASLSATSFPQKLIVVPSLNGHTSPSWHPRVCVLVLCQGMSIATGSNDSLHVPDLKGYTIKCPRTFEHRHRDGVRYFTTLLKYAVTLVEIAAGFVTKVPRRLKDRAMSGLSSIRGVADNMDQLDIAGIAPDAMFYVQDVIDRHQRDAIKKLLLGADRHGKDNITGDLECIVLQDKRRFWVCRQCSEYLQNGDPIDGRSYMMLPQYVSLVKREPKNEVTLNDADSVILLTKSLSKSHETNELIIHLNSTYFEAIERAEGAPFKAIMHMFKKLGKVLKKQKNLTLLEIHGNSTNGKTWIGLRAALKCRALKRLRVTGIPCFFQDKNIPMKCRNLEELSLQDVHLNTDQAAGNLWMLIGMNPCLSRLKMTRTMITATILSKVKPMVTLMQFSRIESLDLSNSDIGEQEVIHFVKMALASDNPRLEQLNLCRNKREHPVV